jgi:serine protease
MARALYRRSIAVKRSRSILFASLATAGATIAAAALVMSTSVGQVSASAGHTVDSMRPMHVMGIKPAKPARPTKSSNLAYGGGTGGVGVETGADKVYLIYWGTQWNSNDPSGEAALQQNFFNHVGGSSWNNSVTQYCEGVSKGTIYCNGAGTAATNPTGVLAGVWYDNAAAAPSKPSQSQIAAEAAAAAAHFGNTSASSNTTVQYVVNTATGNSMTGFGTQWCAWHSSSSTSYGNVAYTYMPYITDAGASCGANFNGLGSNAGITIVGGHEFGETESDIYPSTGWTDSGAENGDKCAWISSGQGASASVSLNGTSFPVQSLWSNAFNNGAGGCVMSY